MELTTEIEFLSEYYTRLDMEKYAAGYKKVELDMGCGKGSFTTQLAERYPDHLILAADVLRGRLTKLAKRNQRQNVNNIRPLRVEARMLIGLQLPDDSIDRLHVLCPDPWPKDRHRGHRLLCSDFMSQIHRVLKDDGQWHFSTDDLPYLQMVRQVVKDSGLFEENNALLQGIEDIKSDFELRWNEEGKKVYHHLWTPKKFIPPAFGH